jgi:hypothetical protein
MLKSIFHVVVIAVLGFLIGCVVGAVGSAAFVAAISFVSWTPMPFEVLKEITGFAARLFGAMGAFLGLIAGCSVEFSSDDGHGY